MTTGPVRPTDFGLPYMLVEKEGGGKILYNGDQDVSELLSK